MNRCYCPLLPRRPLRSCDMPQRDFAFSSSTTEAGEHFPDSNHQIQFGNGLRRGYCILISRWRFGQTMLRLKRGEMEAANWWRKKRRSEEKRGAKESAKRPQLYLHSTIKNESKSEKNPISCIMQHFFISNCS
ncbi:unnamed protein product [Musa banksii]